MRVSPVLGLASLAFLTAFPGQAAEPPAKPDPGVDYVPICSVHGTMFFAIPGTDTCLRIGGRARAEYFVRNAFDRGEDPTGFRAKARLYLDARTPTAYGTLRSFLNLDITRSSGAYLGTSSGPVDAPDLHEAFIQWSGLTAGITQSFFDFFGNGPLYHDIVGSDLESAGVLAYTFTWGRGLSSTLSLEDRILRQRSGGPIGLPLGLTPIFGPPTAFRYAGERLPDLVGNILLDQDWGKAQLSGAVRQLQSDNLVVSSLSPAGVYPDAQYGFALQAGVKFNLKSLSPSDELWLQAAYADGANDYVLGNVFGGGGVLGPTLSAAVPNADAFVDPLGHVRKTKAASAVAMFQHYWTPTIRNDIFAAYARVNYDGGATFSALSPARGGFVDYDILNVGTQLTWIPVANLRIGVEGLYSRLDPRDRIADPRRNPAAGGPYTTGSLGIFDGRVRVERDF